MTELQTEPHVQQSPRWPSSGRHILAQWDDASVVVYQAYRPSIGHYAAAHGHFGGPDFSFDRMSWIKPGFLWMMYRSGWARKPGQEVVLAIRLRREVFDGYLSRAVPSSYWPEQWPSREAWRDAVRSSDVRLQWDPDHAPDGTPVARRAIQLGLRADALRGFDGSALLGVEDVTALVHEQREQVGTAALVTPAERVYPIDDPMTRARLRLNAAE
ncbi:MAG: DUF4291 domain-containing protein [Myxococcales bacterium]|nr:DUF4291 domain-containing protein [Myxococcales bacterium]